MKLVLYFICATLFLSLFAVESAAKKILTLATTDWCPYTCDYQGHKHGLVGDKLEKILSKYGITLSVISYPWSRAIDLANQGKVDGLLTASHSEAPELHFSASPIGWYQMCFYTSTSNAWRYDGTMKFGNNILAIIQNYGYGEPLDSYIKNKPDALLSITGANTTKRLIELLLKDRANIIIEDSAVLDWFSAKQSINTENIKKSGC